MKKLFAFILCMVLLLSNFTIRAEAVTTDEQPDSLPTKKSTSTELEVPEDGKLTLEFLNKMSSWKELVDTVLPLDGDYARIANQEDFNVVMLIKNVNNTLMFLSTKNIKMTMSGLNIEDTDYERLIKKFDTVVNLYNEENKLHIVWESTILNEEFIQVTIRSVDAVELKLGQQVMLKAGKPYWESSLNGGSGRCGIITDDNIDIPENLIVTVNGIAYLNEEETTILYHYYVPYDKLKGQEDELEFCKGRMIHVCTEKTDLGWVQLEDIAKFDCK